MKKMPSLYEQVFNYLYIKKNNFQLGNVVINSYEKIISNYLNKIINYVPVNQKKCKYAFINLKYRELMTLAHKDGGAVVIGGGRSFFYAILKNMSYLSNYEFVELIVRSWVMHDQSCIHFCVNKICEILKNSNIEMVIVSNDSLPLERVFIAAARKASIPAVCFQHGLFSLDGGELNDGKYADTICVYDKYQSQVVMQTGAKSAYIFGFYRKIKNKKMKSGKKIVCILGQPWGEYYGDYKYKYFEYLKKIITFLNKSQIEWRYKPHPSEKIIYQRSDLISHNLERCDINKSIKLFDVFVSLSSTALLEATLAGKIAIQIRCESILCDDFQKYGYCYSLDVNELDSKFIEIYEKSRGLDSDMQKIHLSVRWERFIKNIL